MEYFKKEFDFINLKFNKLHNENVSLTNNVNELEESILTVSDEKDILATQSKKLQSTIDLLEIKLKTVIEENENYSKVSVVKNLHNQIYEKDNLIAHLENKISKLENSPLELTIEKEEEEVEHSKVEEEEVEEVEEVEEEEVEEVEEEDVEEEEVEEEEVEEEDEEEVDAEHTEVEHTEVEEEDVEEEEVEEEEDVEHTEVDEEEVEEIEVEFVEKKLKAPNSISRKLTLFLITDDEHKDIYEKLDNGEPGEHVGKLVGKQNKPFFFSK